VCRSRPSHLRPVFPFFVGFWGSQVHICTEVRPCPFASRLGDASARFRRHFYSSGHFLPHCCPLTTIPARFTHLSTPHFHPHGPSTLHGSSHRTFESRFVLPARLLPSCHSWAARATFYDVVVGTMIFEPICLMVLVSIRQTARFRFCMGYLVSVFSLH
jgi:hypothetical protein